MEYGVKILDGKPFEKRLWDKVIRYDVTVEILFYNEDGSIKKIVEYGYVTMDEIKQYIAEGENLLLDLCYVKELDVQDAKISSISAIGAFFDGKSNFLNALFSSKADFREAIFGGDANFVGTTFSDEADFRRVTFSGEAHFGGATFTGETNFKGVTFGKACFGEVTFSSKAYFKRATFNDSTNFRGARFSDEAGFWGATFCGEADFSSIIFSDDVNFWEATFSVGSYYNHTIFNGEAKFREVIFKGMASFRGVTFCGEANFVGITFCSKVDFCEAIIKSTVLYERTIFTEYINMRFKECNQLEIKECIIEKTIDFGDVYFNKLCLEDTRNLGHIFMDWKRNNIKKAIYAYAIENKLQYYKIAKQFHILKENFNRLGQYDDEDKAYVQYRRNESKSELFNENSDNILKWIVNIIFYCFKYIVYDFIGLYATSPLRVLVALCINILGFGVLYYCLGVGLGDFGEGMLRNLFAGLYYSATASFTVGFANGRILAAGWSIVEGFIGLFLMSYFTVAFTRKVLR